MPGEGRPLVLASASPQRRAILERLGVSFTVRPAAVEELTHGDPETVALENARRKAAAVAASEPQAALVLGVDTLVVLDGEILGKPVDAEHATRTLALLQGRTHRVVSGLVLTGVGTRVEITEVTFRTLDAERISRYVALGEWRGRAGGYAVQESGGALVRRIEGDYVNVVGLPVGALLDLLPDLL